MDLHEGTWVIIKLLTDENKLSQHLVCARAWRVCPNPMGPNWSRWASKIRTRLRSGSKTVLRSKTNHRSPHIALMGCWKKIMMNEVVKMEVKPNFSPKGSEDFNCYELNIDLGLSFLQLPPGKVLVCPTEFGWAIIMFGWKTLCFVSGLAGFDYDHICIQNITIFAD